MKGFRIRTTEGVIIHFNYYLEEAPESVRAFDALLPFQKKFYHARVSGQEIWLDDLSPLPIKQENASVFTLPGEVVLGPATPIRNKTANCLGIYYGEGKGLDAANIFACVIKEEEDLLKGLGNRIWELGAEMLWLDKWD